MFLLDGAGSAFAQGDKSSTAAQELSQLWTHLGYADGSRAPPTGILVVSAHWESASANGANDADGADFEVLEPLAGKDHLLFDYHGFPAESYEYQYPCPTDGALSAKVLAALKTAGLSAKLTPGAERGLDRGVFVPLLVARPEADIPVTQVSLSQSLDPAKHVALGEALAPLRAQGVLVIGSGMVTHNMGAAKASASEDEAVPWAKAFQAWVDDKFAVSRAGECVSAGTATGAAATATDEEKQARREAALAWRTAPSAEQAHPREEHLLPFFVAAAAADFTPGAKLFQTWMATSFSLNIYVWSD